MTLSFAEVAGTKAQVRVNTTLPSRACNDSQWDDYAAYREATQREVPASAANVNLNQACVEPWHSPSGSYRRTHGNTVNIMNVGSYGKQLTRNVLRAITVGQLVPYSTRDSASIDSDLCHTLVTPIRMRCIHVLHRASCL